MTPPSEGRPLPCPECQSTKGYAPAGKFRVHCLNCSSLIKREEVDMQLPKEESTS